MSLLKVINVGQGDSIIYSNSLYSKCDACKYDLLVDLGPGHRDVFTHLNKDNKCILLLSHAHIDHIGGLVYLSAHSNRVHQVWVPCYYEEILTITDFLIQISKNNRTVVNSAGFVNAEFITRTGKLLKQLSSTLNIPFIGVCDGFSPCAHLKVFNPPLDPSYIFGLPASTVDSYMKKSWKNNYEEFRPIFGEDFESWRGTFLSEGWTYNMGVQRITKTQNDNWENRMRFIYSFLLQNIQAIHRFAASPTPNRFAGLLNNVKLTSNRASIVLKVDMAPETALFPGDADKTVFRRLIKGGYNLNSRFFKIPHHGSKYNISKTILRKIQPEIAIVCHNNHLFGRQKDPHPNQEVIQMLDSCEIRALYSNDVVKHGTIVKYKPQKEDYYYGCEYVN